MQMLAKGVTYIFGLKKLFGVFMLFVETLAKCFQFFISTRLYSPFLFEIMAPT